MKKLPLLVAILVWVMVSGCVSTARRVEAPASITAPAAEKLEVKANGGVELQAPNKICWSWSPPPAVEMAWEPKILYHLEVDRREDKISKNKLEYPLFLKPGKKNQLTFYVGPETGVRSLRQLDKEDFELKVSMDCNISEKAPPDKKKANTQMIKYYRRLRSSTPAIFTIVPIIGCSG